MKAEFTLEEIKNLMKKNEKNNRLKTFILVIAGMAVVVGIIVLVISKLKGKSAYEYDDWSELDDMDYDDYDDYDEYDDFEDYDDYDYEEEDYDFDDAEPESTDSEEE